MKIKGRKLKMSQIWKGDILVPVSIIKIESESESGLSQIKEGDLVKVSGVSRGLGNQGVVKRWGFRGGPQTHGQKNRLRHPGSIGNTSPQRIIPGRHMAGRMGGQRCTVKNLVVASVDQGSRLLMLRGAVPGYNKKSLLEIVK